MKHALNLRELEALVEVDACGGFIQAAEKLHVSQPALSWTVRLAEEKLGVRIYERTTRRVALTPDGAELIPVLRRMLPEFGDSMFELQDFIKGRRGRIKVSALPTLAHYVVKAIPSFSAEFPDVEFVIRVDAADTVLTLLEQSEIDLAVTVQPPPDGRFVYDALSQDVYVLICRDDHPLALKSAGDSPLHWADLDGVRLVAPTVGSGTRSAIDAAFSRAGITIVSSHEVVTTDLLVLRSLVLSGIGVTIMPAGASEMVQGTLLVVRRLAPKVMRQAGVVALQRRSLPMAAARFKKHLLAFHLASATPEQV